MAMPSNAEQKVATTAAIKAALDAAFDANHRGADPYDYCPTYEGTAAAIVAFLRAMPGCDVMLARWTDDDPPELNGPHSTVTLAAAVEAAAHE